MKNVTKTNILFTFMVASYLLLIYIVRLIPVSILNINIRLILPELIMLLPAFLYVTVLKPDNLGQINFSSPSVMNVIKIILFTFCVMPFITILNSISTIFVENHAANTMSYLTSNPLWMNILFIALIPAVCEEYLFRGLLFHGYKKRNPYKAMLMSSLLFGLIHMNVNQFIYAFVMGCILCMLVYATGTVLSSMIAHFIFNGINVVISYYFQYIMKEFETVEQKTVTLSAADYVIAYGIQICIAAFGLVLAYSLFKSICRENRGMENIKLIFKKENRQTYDESQGRFFDPYITVGIVLCMIYICAYGL